MRIPIATFALALAVSSTGLPRAPVVRTEATAAQEVHKQVQATDPSGGQLLNIVGSVIRVVLWVDCVTSGPSYPGLTLYVRVLACT